MRVIKLTSTSRNVLHTAITQVGPSFGTSSKVQVGVIDSWLKGFANIISSGPIEVPAMNGLNHTQTSTKVQLGTLIRRFISSIPGSSVCLIARPEWEMDSEKIKGLNDFLASNRMDITWAASFGAVGKAEGFLMTGSVAAYLMQEPVATKSLDESILEDIDEWLKKFLRHRYGDASKLEAFKKIEKSKR